MIQPLYNCQTGAITFRITGGIGPGTPAGPIYFTVPGVVSYSTQARYVVDAAIRNNANSQPLLIKATQGGTVASYVFDFRLYCSGSSRLSAEPTPAWEVRVLGNPVKDKLTVVIAGATGQPLELLLIDMSGYKVESHRVMPVSNTHREVFDVQKQGAGLLFLQVAGGGRSQTVKVLKE